MKRGGVVRVVAVALAAVCFLAGVVAAVVALPTGEGLDRPATEALEVSGVDHGVTAVLLSYRAFDTWLEVVVILAAVMAVLVVTQRAHVWDVSAPREPHPLQARYVHLLAPLLVVVGVYLVAQGTSTVGGAFQGAAVLAGAALLVWLSGDSSPRGLRFDLSTALASAAHLTFLAVAVLTAVAGRPLAYRGEVATAVIVAVEVTVTVSVAVSLALVFLGARASWEED